MIEGARCYGRVILLDILLLLILVACSTMRTTRQNKQSVAGASVSFLMPQSFASKKCSILITVRGLEGAGW
jgi:hypothetical protein